MFTKHNFKKRISILEDGASGEQVGGIEKIMVKNSLTQRCTLALVWYFRFDILNLPN